MALSGFIKQLLETDTVFGSEAKKMTGINDSVIKVLYSNVDISLTKIDGDDNTLQFIINNYDGAIPPSWLREGKYILFNFADFDPLDPAYVPLLNFEDKVFQVSSITSTSSTLTITFVPGAEKTPIFSNLPEILNLTVNVRLDGRIFALIGDSEIARPSSSGSTMFNVDNMDSTGFDVDSSGISKKFASHYHTDIVSEATFNERDEEGNTLARAVIASSGESVVVVYDEIAADEITAESDQKGADLYISITSDSEEKVVAQYGPQGTFAKGTITNLLTTGPGLPGSTGNITGEGINYISSPGIGEPGIQIVVYCNLVPGIESELFRNWPVEFGAQAQVTIAGPVTPGLRFQVYRADNLTTPAYRIFASHVDNTGFSFLIDNNDFGAMANNLGNAIRRQDSAVRFYREGGSLFLRTQWVNRNNMGLVAVIEPSQIRLDNFNLSSITNINIVRRDAMDNLVETLTNSSMGEFYTFSFVGSRDVTSLTEIGIALKSKGLFEHYFTTTLRDLDSPTSLQKVDLADQGTDRGTISGNEFFTTNELASVLTSSQVLQDFGIDVQKIDNTFSFSSPSPGTRSVTVAQPSINNFDPPFVNAKGGNNLIDLPIIPFTFEIKQGSPELVIDTSGSVVFNFPTTIYTEGRSVIP